MATAASVRRGGSPRSDVTSGVGGGEREARVRKVPPRYLRRATAGGAAVGGVGSSTTGCRRWPTEDERPSPIDGLASVSTRGARRRALAGDRAASGAIANSIPSSVTSACSLAMVDLATGGWRRSGQPDPCARHRGAGSRRAARAAGAHQPGHQDSQRAAAGLERVLDRHHRAAGARRPQRRVLVRGRAQRLGQAIQPQAGEGVALVGAHARRHHGRGLVGRRAVAHRLGQDRRQRVVEHRTVDRLLGEQIADLLHAQAPGARAEW